MRGKSMDNGTFRINKDYQSLLPPFSEIEFYLLKQSIKEDGLHIPIIVNKHGVILDGHHRFRACKELGFTPEYYVMEFKDSLEEKQFVIESNLRRRQLGLFQRVEVGYNLEDIEKEIAKRRMSLGGHIVGLANKKENYNNNDVERRVASIDATLPPSEEKGKVSQIIAKKIGVSTATYERGKKIIEKGTEEQKNNLSTIGMANVYNQIRRQEKKDLIRQVRQQQTASAECQHDREQHNTENSRAKLIQSDFQEIDSAAIGDSSIDLIFTDPPFKREWLPLYEPLGKLASRVLKEGGSLVMSAGHHALPQIFDYMKNSGLKYWWAIVAVVRDNGSPRLLQNQHVYVMWKPLLWFVKGSRLRTLDSIADLIDSKPPRKVLHDDGQSSADAEYVISKLTVQDDVVFDPLMGAARTGIAALRLKRRFIGSEKDKDAFALAKATIDRELSYIGAR
jgi:ParB-like chromosome segregation protein Spo0J